MLNEVHLIGRLGRDPEIRATSGGEQVANVSVATSERWKDKQSGETKEKTEWHRVVIWGRLADVVEKYMAKGTLVYIKGKSRTRKWSDKAGVEKYTTEVVVDRGGEVRILADGRGKGDGGEEEKAATKNQDGALDDDIPF